jgi:hypothetical protein
MQMKVTPFFALLRRVLFNRLLGSNSPSHVTPDSSGGIGLSDGSDLLLPTSCGINGKDLVVRLADSNLPIPYPPAKKKSTDLKPPVLHFIDV